MERSGTDAVRRILEQLREVAGIDFSAYKRTTIERRLERQQARLHFETLDDYAQHLEAHPSEARSLYEDLLIHVTEFFREPAAIAALVTTALPQILEAKPDSEAIRVWVPGCSTGQEVYSLGMELLDAIADRGGTHTVQLFGSDLSERAVAAARAGRYPAAIAEQVGEDRLARYFDRDGRGWRVKQRLREQCVFVQHDLTVDPPFSRLDLVSCRNVLIYLGPALQHRVIATLHFALEQPGFLLAGMADSLVGSEAMFEQVAGLPLFRRKPVARTSEISFTRTGSRRPEHVRSTADVFREADHALLARYAPACVLVDENFDILQFRGRTGAFLEPAPGHPQINVLKMARAGLAAELRRLAQLARRDDVTVRSTDIVIGKGAESRRVDLEIIPLRTLESTRRHFLVTFHEAEPTTAPAPVRKRKVKRGTIDRVEQLEQELLAAKEYLTSIITQQAATTEEVGVVNEELQSANEELRSANDELSVAKEELQSSNDELESVNLELERGNVELHRVNDDLVNVLASVEIAVILVDAARRVRRFTPNARTMLKLIDGDIGRPIADLKPRIAIGDLDGMIAQVIDSGVLLEREVRDDAENVYRMQIQPYRTSQGQVGGAVITLVDVTVLRHSIEDSRRAREAELFARNAARREKDAFINAVSHELRTPLSAILLWAEVVRGVAADDPQIMRAIHTIEDSARAEAQLVDDLLDLALAQTNAEALAVAAVPLAPSPIVEATAESLRSLAADKGVTIALDLDHDALVVADARRLKQIAWHLIANAIKFTPLGGEVDVSVARVDGGVELVVRDTGKGIHAQMLDRVFEPFSQGDFSTSRDYGGLGIGLALVRHLVERHGGTIHTTSDGDGRGATFTVRLVSDVVSREARGTV